MMSKVCYFVIRVENFVKFYGGVQVLRGIGFGVQCGEIFGFFGFNGVGKTIVICCMLDLICFFFGLLRIVGYDFQRDLVVVRVRCGYLFGELCFDENIVVNLVLRFF